MTIIHNSNNKDKSVFYECFELSFKVFLKTFLLWWSTGPGKTGIKQLLKNPETCVRLSNALPLNVGPHSGIRKNDVFLPYIL